MKRIILMAGFALACTGYGAKVQLGGGLTADSGGALLPIGTVTLVQAAATSRMPIYVTPYYNSDPLQVNVGRASQQLAAATADSITELAATMKKEWLTLPVETMFVMAIRLYDLGHKDDAVYWFYSAQFRARLLRALLPEGATGGIGSEGRERAQAHTAFHQLCGKYINGYAFGELGKLEATIRRVQADNASPPQFKTIYPRLEWIDDSRWPGKREEVSAGLDKLLEYIAENADEIQAIRKQRGMEGKY